MGVRVFTVPADAPESDGTLEWDRTTLVLVEVEAGGAHGIGWTYASRAAAALVHAHLREAVEGCGALDVPAAHARMQTAIRNQGRTGIGAMAVSAVDVALWDLKAKLLGVPLAALLGAARDSVPVYGSGGFTSMPVEELEAQLGAWAMEGFSRVKMKVGRQPGADPARVAAARRAVGDDVELFVDANGAYSRKEALLFSGVFAQEGVSWFEEPVSSDDLEGLRLVRDRVPAGMDIAAGEYAWTLDELRRLAEAGAADVLQVDVTRCGGFTGVLRAAALAEAFHLPLSAHCAPSLHVALGMAIPGIRHLEWFHDHQRIESRLFDGFRQPVEGEVSADTTRPGLGVELIESEAGRFEAH